MDTSNDSVIGVSNHPQKELLEELWRDGKRASELVEVLKAQGLPPIKKTTLARYGQRYWSDSNTFEIPDADIDALGDTLAELGKHGTVKKVSWTEKTSLGWEKNEDGSNVQVEKPTTACVIEVDPAQTTDPIDVSVGPFNITSSRSAPQSNKPEGFKLLVDFPDKQTGYFRHDDELHAIHDEDALNVSYQILADLESSEGVDVVVNQGDDLDFAEFSSHRSPASYKGLLNKNLNRHATDLAIQRETCPSAEIVQLWGNHEARLEKFLVDKAPELLGVSRVGEEDPTLSISYLCKYEDKDITTVGPYPGGDYWANDYLRFTHGTLTSSIPGGAAGKVLSKSNGVSTVYGHDHYHAVAHDRVLTRDGMRNVFAASAGCLCRVDGAVPSSSSGIRSNGALTSKERWQQGILVIYFEPEGLQRSFVEPVIINNGSAMFRGRTYDSKWSN